MNKAIEQQLQLWYYPIVVETLNIVRLSQIFCCGRLDTKEHLVKAKLERETITTKIRN